MGGAGGGGGGAGDGGRGNGGGGGDGGSGLDDGGGLSIGGVGKAAHHSEHTAALGDRLGTQSAADRVKPLGTREPLLEEA